MAEITINQEKFNSGKYGTFLQEGHILTGVVAGESAGGGEVTKEDFDALVELVNTQAETIATQATDITALKADMTTANDDITQAKADITDLKTRVAALENPA